MSDDVDGAGAWEQHEGDTDMPEYAVAYNKGWDAGIKQGGAEVLAACIERVNKMAEEYPEDSDQQRATHSVATELLLSLQPAASALEELRSRAYRDGATGAAVWFVKLLHGHPEDPPHMGCKPEAIVEKLEALLRPGQELAKLVLDAETISCETFEWEQILEKARASDGKGGE